MVVSILTRENKIERNSRERVQKINGGVKDEWMITSLHLQFDLNDISQGPVPTVILGGQWLVGFAPFGNGKQPFDSRPGTLQSTRTSLHLMAFGATSSALVAHTVVLELTSAACVVMHREEGRVSGRGSLKTALLALRVFSVGGELLCEVEGVGELKQV